LRIACGLLLLAILAAISCSDSTSDATDRYHSRIREKHQLDYLGKPVVRTTYEYDENGRLIREFTRDSTKADIYESEILRVHDAEKLIRIEAYDPAGTPDYIWTFEYMGQQLVREFGTLSSDSIFEEIIYTRSADGRIISEETRSGLGSTTRIYEYDTYGRLSKAQSLDQNGFPDMVNTFSYNDADTLADTIRFITPGGASRVIVNDYDDAGHKTAEKEPRPDGSNRLIKTYGYDLEGNILFEQDHQHGSRVDYLYENGNLNVVKYSAAGGRTVGLVFYE